MKKFCSLFFIFLFVFVLVACNKEANYYEISLVGNGNSYYNWSYEIEDESVLSIVDEKYYGEEVNDEIKGLGGEYVFNVLPLKEGKTRINFNYIKTWDETDILYSYYVDLEVDDSLNIKQVKEMGNYLSLLKFINVDREILGLENDFNDYMLIFSDDVVDIGDDECDWLAVYDYEDNFINAYGISNSNNNIYKLVDEEKVLISKD